MIECLCVVCACVFVYMCVQLCSCVHTSTFASLPLPTLFSYRPFKFIYEMGSLARASARSFVWM